MTIKQFSEKYDVPYQTVYDATYTVKGIKRQYPEDELYHEIMATALKRISKHEEIIHRQLEIVQKMMYAKEQFDLTGVISNGYRKTASI